MEIHRAHVRRACRRSRLPGEQKLWAVLDGVMVTVPSFECG